MELCPPAFQETDRARLRADLVDKVLSWQMGPTGLVLYGDTGGGKTRTLWLLLRRLVVDEAIHVRVLSAFDFSAEASDAYRNGTEKAFVSTLAGSVGVLVIDDLGKAKITARVAEALFEIVDRRTAAGRPLIVTTNDVGERLKERFEDQNAAEPLLRRLREFCAAINFRR
ncbi:MAG: ATP-binding protein [Verrucomicrobium sp.]|nr:ATP-binding protein [Verrucomicrobium sp.]